LVQNAKIIRLDVVLAARNIAIGVKCKSNQRDTDNYFDSRHAPSPSA